MDDVLKNDKIVTCETLSFKSLVTFSVKLYFNLDYSISVIIQSTIIIVENLYFRNYSNNR